MQTISDYRTNILKQILRIITNVLIYFHLQYYPAMGCQNQKMVKPPHAAKATNLKLNVGSHAMMVTN